MKKNKKIFIHIGFHKTMTTWIQENYFNMHDQILYLGKLQNDYSKSIINIFRSIYYTSDTDFSSIEVRKDFNKILEKNNKNNFSIIGLSDEGISGGLDWFGQSSFTPAKRLKEIFYDYDVKIILGIREQFSMLRSIYTEYLKFGGTNSINRLLNEHNQNGKFLINKVCYSGLINEYISLFGISNLHIYLYEDFSLNTKNEIENLSNFLGISNVLKKRSYKSTFITGNKENKLNRSPSFVTLNILRFVNCFFFTPYNRSPILPLNYIITMLVISIYKLKLNRIIFYKKKIKLNIKKIDYYDLEHLVRIKVHTKVLNSLLYLDEKLFFFLPKLNMNKYTKNKYIKKFSEDNIITSKLIKLNLNSKKYP